MVLRVFSRVVRKILSRSFKARTHGFKIESTNTIDGIVYLTIRISGKCTPPIIKTPYELCFGSICKLATMFSEEDCRIIIKAMLENESVNIKRRYQKKYQMVKHQFSENTGEPLLVYKNIITCQYYIKSAIEVFSDIALLKEFDSEDCACIGNIVGSYEAEKEINNLRSNGQKISIVKFDN